MGEIRSTGVGVRESHDGRLGIVCAWDHNSLHDFPVHWTVPAVVLRGAEESLINGPANELGCESVIVEHMVQRVRFTFKPEGVERFDVVGNAVDGRLAGTVNNRVVIQEHDGAHTRFELSGEEVVPGFKSVILRGRVAYVCLYEAGHGGTPTGTKPAGRVSGEDVARLRRGEE